MKLLVGSVVLVATQLLDGSQSNTSAPLDAILRHGTIVDGSGLPLYRGDLGIMNGYVAAIGDLEAQHATVELNVDGLYVAPGFISIHSHASPDGLLRAENMLTQGVTTEILNPDGGGEIDIAAQLARLKSAGLAVNIGAYIGFNSVWEDVVGPADRRATSDEIDRMRTLVVNGLAAGAWGVSAGLDYKPAYYAQTGEVIKVVESARRWRTNFTNHERITPESGFSSRSGIAETIRIGEAAGLVPVVTHMKVQGPEVGSAPVVLGMLRKATVGGHYAAADVYPYLAGRAPLAALIIPAWAQDGGRPEMLKRFQNPDLRARIITESEEVMKVRFGGPEGVYLLEAQKEFVTVMSELHVSAGEAVVRLLEQGNPSAVMKFGIEGDLRPILQYADAAVACDCGSTTSTAVHPRGYGTFPRVLGRYVREAHVLTWEDAVRKMTALPAAIIGMVDRGYLVPGMVADITVFDPRTVIDRATYENPTAPSEGIRYVLVNGRLALRDGRVTGTQAGQAVMRTPHMPSRPMRVNVARRVAAKSAVTSEAGSAPSRAVEIAFDVKQKPGARQASGFFRLTDPGSGTTIDMKTISLLQTAEKWASFTGRSQLRRNGDVRSITVTIEQADAFAGDRATVTVDAEGIYRLKGSLASANIESGTER